MPQIIIAGSGMGKYVAWKTSEVRTIYGWYRPFPKAGDYFECPIAGGMFVYELDEVTRDSARGPDYFEARVRAIGYKELLSDYPARQKPEGVVSLWLRLKRYIGIID